MCSNLKGAQPSSPPPIKAEKEPKVSPKFKVRDTVKIPNGRVGQVVSVSEVFSTVNIDGMSYEFFNDDIKWIQSPPPISEPSSQTDEALFEIFKAGHIAIQELAKRKVLEVRSRAVDNWNLMGKVNELNCYRLKPKQVMTPFNLKDSGHHVTYKDKTVSVGCKNFDLYVLKTAITNILVAELSSTSMGEYTTLRAARNGVRYGDALKFWSISWADAEQLYNAIKDIK